MSKMFLLTGCALALIACGPAPDRREAAREPAGTAQASQGRANLAPASTAPFSVATIGEFSESFAMAFLPDGGLLVTEKAGRLKLRARSGAVSTISGLPPVAMVDQGGLLDVAVAPDFATSHIIYLTYSEPRPAGSSLALARATLDGGALHGLAVIWRAGSDGDGGQFGATIAFAPDGRSLFLSSGERQRFTPAQDGDQALGKIVHLTLDGRPAPGNPDAGRLGATSVMVTSPPKDTVAATSARAHRVPARAPNLTPAETWSSGHRNPYGLAFDKDGRLWEIEMGPKGGDELNLIVAGRNYGWPIVSNGDNYDGKPIPDHPTRPEFEAPKLWWNPSISPAGLIIYSGAMFPQWRGSAFIGALSGEALIRVTLSGDTAAPADQWSLGMRIRDVAQAPDGAIWLLSDDGALMRLTPK